MVEVAVIPYWRDCLIMLHSLLYPLLCPDAITDKCCCKGCVMGYYILSFAQMLLPISAAAKGVLWAILFGLAKTCQYGGLTILGVEGYNRVKDYLKRKKRPT